MKNLLTLAFALCLVVGVAAQAATPLDQASSFYAQHDYAKSLQMLDRLSATARSARSQYYRALNLQALHRYDEAYSEFSAVAKQKKDARLAVLAQQGLSGLAHRSKFSSSSVGSASISSGRMASSGLKPDAAGNFTDSRWQVQHEPDPSKVVTEVQPSPFQIIQTSPGCGHHRH